MASAGCGSTHSAAPHKEVSRRTISRELLAAMERTNPLEAALASLLIKEGAWALAE